MTTCTTPPRPLDWRPAEIDNPCPRIIAEWWSPGHLCAAPPWKPRTLATMNGECWRWGKQFDRAECRTKHPGGFTLKPGYALMEAMRVVALPHR